MKTEELQRQPRGLDAHEVSPALQDLLPSSWKLVDRRGRRVPLTSAGYVLRFGQAYRLQLVSPFKSDEIEQVRIVSPAPFIAVEPTLHDEDEQGREVHIVPFKVRLDLWSILRRLGMTVFGDELEVEHDFKPGKFRRHAPLICPIVVRPRWATVLIAVVGGLLLMVVERLVSSLFVPVNTGESLDNVLQAAQQQGTWWYFLALAAAVWLAVNLVNVFLLYRRSRELRDDFREMYPVA